MNVKMVLMQSSMTMNILKWQILESLQVYLHVNNFKSP